MAIAAFCRLSGAASRHADARMAAAGTPAGCPAAVAAAERRTELDDVRIAHTLARFPEVDPNELTPLGLIPPAVMRRLQAARTDRTDRTA